MSVKKITYEELLKENRDLKLKLKKLENFNGNDLHGFDNKNINDVLYNLIGSDSAEEEENQFKVLTENILDVIWIMNLDGSFRYVSPSALRLFKYTEEELNNLSVKYLLTKSSYLKHQTSINQRVEKENAGEITGNIISELEHIKKNGETFWGEVVSGPIRNNHGKINGILGITRDITERRKDREEIERLSVVVEQNPASVLITDVDGNIEYVNAAFCKVTGYSFEEVRGKNPRFLKSGKTPENSYKLLWGTILLGNVWKGEFINRRKNGEDYWEKAVIAPIKDENGAIINFVSIEEDISAQKKVQEQLKNSKERYKLLSDISLEGILIHENGIVKDVNKSITEITGFSAEELIGENQLTRLFAPESLEIIQENSEKEYNLAYEVTGLKKDGSKYPVEIEIKHHKYKQLNARVVVLRDLSYKKRTEDVLRTSLKLNELLNTNTEEEIIEWGLKEAVRLAGSSIGFFHIVNDDQETIDYQKWLKQILGKNVISNKIEEYPIKKASGWIDSFYQKKPVIQNEYMEHRAKEDLPKGYSLVRYISLPVIEVDKVKMIFGVANKTKDYTQFDLDVLSLFAKTIWMVVQRKRTEKMLINTSATKDKFFSLFSHDLRSPIGSIMSLTDMMTENYVSFSNEDIEEFIKIINETSNRTYKLLDNMLVWARAQQKSIEFNPKIIDLNQIIRSINQIYKENATRKNISVRIHVVENLHVIADDNMLNTVLRNVLSNAIKFTQKGGEVVIQAMAMENGFAKISIKDNGVGIPENKIEKLFSIGENVSTKGTENEKGTGLGLLLCKEFVEQNGGRIWVETEAGKGSNFFFTLPLK